MTAIVVHGGAGAVTVERHPRLREAVRIASAAGHAILAGGGRALDAVVAAVRILEDDPELNAGTGSVLTREGTVETDAAVMDGVTQRAGAVGAVPELGAAIALARAVLEAGEHVLLVGEAALRFGAEVGIHPAPPGTLITERARERLRVWLASRTRSGEGGTVGAVARDRAGRFASATSTGGMVGKRCGRVGDTPIIGAGTWADRTCAISATGDGEAILRVALSRSIAFRRASGDPLDAATRAALTELAAITGGSAGVIAIDAASRVMLQLSATMPVAWVDDAGAGDSMGVQIPAS